MKLAPPSAGGDGRAEGTSKRRKCAAAEPLAGAVEEGLVGGAAVSHPAAGPAEVPGGGEATGTAAAGGVA